MNSTQKIYEILLSTNKNNPITARKMAEILNITILEVRKGITALRARKIRVESNSKGYYLPSDMQNPPSTIKKHTGPYRVVITDGNGEVIRDVEFDDHLTEVLYIHIRSKLANGRDIKL